MSRAESRGRRNRRGLIIISIFLAGLLATAYLWSIQAYGESIEGSPTEPPTDPNGVAVLLVPYDVDAENRTVAIEVVIFPGANLLSPEGRLKKNISIDAYASLFGTITFPTGEVPAPIRGDLPALGTIQEYPFDRYRLAMNARAFADDGVSRPEPMPMSVNVYFRVAGWSYSPTVMEEGFSSVGVASEGVITRAGGTITIATIFILLIVLFGVLAVTLVVAGWAGRMELTIATAAWLTSALFALVTLRNSLPGRPPLGSWMDVLAYFWVIAVIMLMVGATIATMTLGASNSTIAAEEAEEQEELLPPTA